MAIPALPVCELEQLDLPCLSLFEEGETMLDRIFARISEYLNVGCEGLRAFIAHSEPVTTESDWIATWFIGETERFGSAAGLNTIMPIPETEVRWGFKMVESGFSFPFTRAPEGLTSLDLDLAHAQARVLYSHGALLRSADNEITKG